MRTISRHGTLALVGIHFTILLFAVCPTIQAAQVTTVANLSLSEGQNYFDGAAGSLAGSADVLVTPVVKFSDRWSLFPTYHGYYLGNQQIQSFAGGGTLFNESTGQSVLLKSVTRLGAWKIKPSVGVGFEWLKETENEDWGQGLFDYRRFSGGLESEYQPSDRWGGRLAYDYYKMEFPNYTSLESEQDPTYSRELAGEKVLDSQNHMGTLELWTVLPGAIRAEAGAYLTGRLYDDQPVVNSQGQLEPCNRRDNLLSTEVGLARGFHGLFDTKLRVSLDGRWNRQLSNQNHYDPEKYVYQENYYGYKEWLWIPAVSVVSESGAWITRLSGSFERRDYDDRKEQDVNGTDQADLLWVKTTIGNLSVTRRVTERASLVINGSVGRSRSNTDYENVFQYTYRMASWGLGFNYEY
jgi:hypothetical protein